MKFALRYFLILLFSLQCAVGWGQYIIPPVDSAERSKHSVKSSSIYLVSEGEWRDPLLLRDDLSVEVQKLSSRHESENDSVRIMKREAMKKKLQYNGPWKEQSVSYKNDPDSVLILKTFAGNSTQSFTPMDNTLAISKDGTIISAINAHYNVYTASGVLLFSQTFKTLAAKPALIGKYFDPRVAYDSQADRFVMLCLHGSDPANSNILLFASKSNNPLDGWYVYQYSGNPGANGLWVDFPSMAISNDEIFVSCNQFNEEEKFHSSVIYQLPKDKLYANQVASARVWMYISSESTSNPFTVTPVGYGHKGNYGPGMYFISTRSGGGVHFDLFHLDNVAGANPQLLNYKIDTKAYTVPADAFQKGSSKTLDVGDCRVLSSFYLDGLIHFTFNTGNSAGFSTIRYNRLDVASKVNVELQLASPAGVDYAYGSVASFSKHVNNKAVIVGYLYSGQAYYPSARFAYIDDQMNAFSKPDVLAGSGPIEMLGGNEERWGDYTTVTRNHQSAEPSVWLAVSGGRTDKRWQNMIAQIGGDQDTLYYDNSIRDINVFPNPVYDKVSIRFMLEYNMRIEILLYDMQGKAISLYNDRLGKGMNELRFDERYLANGVYIVAVKSGKAVLKSEKILIAR